LLRTKDCCTYLLLHAQQDAVAHSKDYMASSGRIIDEFERICKEVVVALIIVLFLHLSKAVVPNGVGTAQGGFFGPRQI
jgi:hypothetical protein